MTTIYVWAVSVIASRDHLLEQLQEETHSLHNQNLELEDQLLHDEAYTTIYTEATKRGFAAAKLLYLQKTGQTVECTGTLSVTNSC